MNTQAQLELTRLLSSLCEGELAAAEHDRLEELLAEPEARGHYLQYIDLHARLLAHPALGANHPLPMLDALRGQIGQAVNGAMQPATPSARRSRRLPRLVSYGLVAATTLALTLVFQVILSRTQPAPKLAEHPAQELPTREEPTYVATLVQAAELVWEGGNATHREGSRFLPGELRVKQGIARIHFDSGVELVVQGPAALQLESPTAATLLSGKVVFRADDAAAPFTLSTPTSTLVDTGTEYAVEVGPEREEVHVFAGEVQRALKTAREGALPQLLAAGEARRYDNSAAASGEAAAFEPEKFIRQMPPTAEQQPDSHGALLAHEGFAYDDPNALRSETAGGGTGWAAPWGGGFARLFGQRDDIGMALNVKEGLTRAVASSDTLDGSFDHAGFAKYFRKLALPVRLDADGVYYLSFLFRRGGPPGDPLNSVSVQFRQTEELALDQRDGTRDMSKRLNFGVDRTNELFTHLERVGSRTPLPLSFGETYLLVAKVVASGEHPDQVFLRVYGPEEPVDREEPGSWSAFGPPIHSDVVFDWMEIHINSVTRHAIDELRLGTTWSSVTASWTASTSPKNLP